MSEATVLSEIRALSKELALAQIMPQALKNKPADVLAIVLTGKELGLDPMTSLRSIHIINGKASLSSDLLGALVQKSPAKEYLSLVESSATVATYKAKRRGEPEVTLSFTIAQAKAAGILSNPNWQKYPEAMLRARAQAAICRAVFPDVCMGIYDADSGELEDSTPEPKQDAQREHIEKVKAELRSQIVDGEVVKSEPVKSEPANWEAVILNCKSVEEIQGLIPELQKLVPELRKQLLPVYAARKTELEAK